MKRSAGIILSLLILAFALRVLSLSAQSIWWDEAFTWQTTSHGWANFWQMLLNGDRNPPLYFASVALWGNLAGWSEFSLRSVSLAWSMLGLAFLLNLAKRLYNASAGRWVLALAAAAPVLVVYAQEARMYAAFFTLTAATLYFGMRVAEFGIEAHRRAIRAVEFSAFLGCEAALLLTHYFAVPLVVALNLLALLMLQRRRARFTTYGKWIGGQILAAVPMVIWTLMVFTTPGSLINARETPPGVLSFLDQAIMLWLSGVRDLKGDWIALPWLAFLILPMAAIGAWLVDGRSTRWVAAFTAISLGAAYAMTQALTSFHPRYVLAYSLPLFVMLGAALSNLSAQEPAAGKRKRSARQLVGIVTAVLMVIALVAGEAAASAPFAAKGDARLVAAYLKQNAAAEDVILLEANDYTLSYYDHGPAQTKMITATIESEAFRQLQDAIGTAQRVWLPHWAISTQDSRGYWPFLLEQSGSLKSQTSFLGYELSEYVLQAPLRVPELKPTTVDGVVTQYSDFNGQGADGVLAFALTWRPPVKYSDSAQTSVRLLDARGTILSARDTMLLDAERRTTDLWPSLEPVTNYYVLPIPPGTPPGTYTITAQLYDTRGVQAIEKIGAIDLPRRLDTTDPYRTFDGYDWHTPAHAPSLPGLTLDTYAISPLRPWQAMPIAVTLRWRKTGEVSDTIPHLRLAQGDRVWSEIESDLLEHDYPIGQWVEGETVIDRLRIDYPPVRGPIDLQIGQGNQWSTLTTLRLDESQIEFDPPSRQHAQSAQFGDFAELLGYDLKSDSLSPGRSLDLRLYWRATNTEPITTAYTVFTQILAPDGHLVAQHDAPPDPATTRWVPGQIVTDNHLIGVVDPAYRGPATLIAGWYNSATIERVPAHNGGDYVMLSVPVRVENQ